MMIFVFILSKIMLYFWGFYLIQGEKMDGLLKEEELHVMSDTNEFQNRWEVNLEGESENRLQYK